MNVKSIIVVASLILGASAVEGGKMPNTNPTSTDCLAAAIYYEARAESRLGQLAVAQVVLNRGDNPCKTINQPGQFSWRTKKRLYYDDYSYNLSKTIIQSGFAIKGFQATHFHNLGVTPIWTGYITTIGNHKFYKMPPAKK